MITPKLLLPKNDTVNFDVHPAIAWAETIIFAFFAAHGFDAIVTCAKDGAHSYESRHFWMPEDKRPAQAIDLRFWGIQNQPYFFKRMASALNKAVKVSDCSSISEGAFTILLESDHAHVEWNELGVLPNLKSYVLGQDFYIAKKHP